MSAHVDSSSKKNNVMNRNTCSNNAKIDEVKYLPLICCCLCNIWLMLRCPCKYCYLADYCPKCHECILSKCVAV